MGVPKFYRWLSERYPCLSEVVKEYQIPEFDNLYLDMNGIIHICSHPNDDDPHFRITEEKIFQDIFHYIEWLFRLIKPRKVFFMAVDGVAPRAKMNQQRGRRFRTAREAMDADAKALERGEVLPTAARFDSNCITPGTEFMVRLNDQLKYLVNMKITNDPLWQGPRIYLSGHETPGEGEHKIMDFIRHERSQPNYDPNTRHCLYGLDADLIMLGLCTHDPHFSLLREEIRYTGKKNQKRIPTPEETTYHLLHLSLLREYLEHEFSSVRSVLPFEFDLESIVDDWVLMGFLVGNDFIPNLPHLHIVHGALPTLYKTYLDVLPTLDGYINEKGSLNLVRFEKYMEKLAESDYEHFNEQYADLKWFDSKKSANGFVSRRGRGGRHQKEHNRHQRKGGATKRPKTTATNKQVHDVVPVGKLIDFSDNEGGGDLEDEGGGGCIGQVDADEEPEEEEAAAELDDAADLFQAEFRQHKRAYYIEKLEYEQVTPEVLREQAECFVRAIQWNLHYYYNGVCSWSWYYPHHYAPYISDIRNFSQMKLHYDYGTPFHAFEQLLAVLPAASKKLLPEPYQFLMCDSNSPIIDYYPVDFTTDLNGKQQDWEAVVQIPFIDEKRLLSAMSPLTEKLTPGEKKRNTHGPCLLYTYSQEPLGTYPSALPGHLPDIVNAHARCTHIPLDGFRVEISKLRKGLCQGIRLDVHFPGFPSLKHIKHTAQLKKAEVKVFQMISRGENMILKIENGLDMETQVAAQTLLDTVVYVGWPHLIEAKVVAVSDANNRFTLVSGKESKGSIQRSELVRDEGNVWRLQRDSTKETYFNRWGVEIGDTNVLVHAVPLIGRNYICASGSKVTLTKMWASNAVAYAMQTIVKDILVQDSSFQQYQTLEELFPPDSVCFLTITDNYGCMCRTMEVCAKPKGYIQVNVEVLEEPDLDRLQQMRANMSSGYMPGYLVAQKLGISGLLLSRITGTLYIKGGAKGNPSINQKGNNIGLNLKFNKKNEEAFGFAKKIGDNWTYSPQTVEVMELYLQSFPELFDYLQTKMREDNYYEDDIVAACSGKLVFKDLLAFLKLLPSYSAVHQTCGSETIEANLVKEIEEAVDKVSGESKTAVMLVKARCLYRPSYTQGCSLPDAHATYQLLDRVVNVRSGYSVPLGLRGTIIGIQSAEKDADIVYQIVFDKEFPGGITIRCSPNRGYFLPSYALINLTHGFRMEHPHHKPTAVVHPQYNKPDGNRIVYDHSVPSKSGGESSNSGTKNYRNEKAARRPPQTSNWATASPDFPSVHTESPELTNYPNTLNHSPNSPFIARQPQQLRTRPQFVTPKMATPNYQVSPRQQPQGQKPHAQDSQNQETEFQELWRNLLHTGKSADALSTKHGNTIPALQQAAKSLPKKQMEMSGDEVLLRQGPPPMPAFGVRPSDASTLGASSEFSSMFNALEKQQTKSAAGQDAESLSGLLSGLLVTKESGAVGSSSNETTPSAHRYSKQISVEQLFKETRESEIKTAHGNKGVDYVESATSRETRPAPMIINNYVTALMNACQERFGGVPTYSYKHMGSAHSVAAQVTLPDGTTHCGAVSNNNQAAAQSAARQAFQSISMDTGTRNLVSQGRTPVGAGLLPHPVMTAANRTGAPVRMNCMPPTPHMMQSAGIAAPHMYQRPPYPGAYLHSQPGAFMMQPPPAPYFPHPAYGAVRPNPRQTYGGGSSGGWGSWQGHPLQQQQQHQQQQRPSADHPFVPLQVTRQKMTPRKYSSSESTSNNYRPTTEQHMDTEHSLVRGSSMTNAMSSLGAELNVTANETKNNLHQQQQQRNAPTTANRGRSGSNKRGSRLAINFSGQNST